MRKQYSIIIIAASLLLVCQQIQAQTPYALTFSSLEGASIPLEAYGGRKLLITVFDASSPDIRQLRMLDSLYRADSAILSVIAVPAFDFGEPLDSSTLTYLLKDSLGLLYPVTQPGMAGKSSEDQQQPLLFWLTHVESNGHFDKDITEDGKMYLISESGSLYALLQKNISTSELNDAIHQTITL